MATSVSGMLLTGVEVTVNRLAPSSAPSFPNPQTRGSAIAPFNAAAETYHT